MIQLRLLLLVTLFCLALSKSQAQEEKISQQLIAELEESALADFWVILKAQHTVQMPSGGYLSKEDKAQLAYEQLRGHAKQTQASILPIIQRKSKYFKAHFLVNVILVRGDKALAEELAQYKVVKSLVHLPEVPLEDFSIEAPQAASRNISTTWGIDSIGASSVWEEFNVRGEGAVIGNQDTGVEWQHVGLFNSYRGNLGDSGVSHSYHWHDAIKMPEDTSGLSLNPCGYETKVPCDDHDHGTHTVGTSVGKVRDYVFGVAPEANWVACRNMDRGRGTPETYIDCFEWFLAPTDTAGQNPRPDLAPHVVNNSWSCPPSEGCHPDNFFVMELAVNNLRASGVVVVVSAGNSGRNGCGTVQTPAAIFESSFTVGSIQQNDTISAFSSIGPVVVDSSGRLKPQLVAPGSNVNSSIRNNDFRSLSGTSMAGPHVAGAVALMVSANPLIAGQVDTIEAILKNTADPRRLAGRDCGPYTGLEEVNHIYGHGRLNVYKAVEQAMAFDTSGVSSINTRYNDSPVAIYPNPATDRLNLKYIRNWEGTEIAIFDLTGRLRRVVPIAPRIDISMLPGGIYFLELRKKGEKHFFKFLKL